LSEIRFGPAGNSEAFYAEGHKHTYEAPAWLGGMGLSAFEYSFGRGARLREETGEKIRLEAERNGIALSAHAPYYINLANDELEKNMNYFRESSVSGGYLGAARIVFHPGSPGKRDRAAAFASVKKNLGTVMGEMKRGGFGGFIYCAETMGKINQIGSLEEIIELCGVDERVYPAIDFGHLNARTLGGIKAKPDYAAILDALRDGVGREKYKNMHIHFSQIEYTAMGERTHLTLEDTRYGPFFRPLAELLAERGLTPVVICESKGTQAHDAVKLREMYEAAL
jgi:deoxyribonuclease-4